MKKKGRRMLTKAELLHNAKTLHHMKMCQVGTSFAIGAVASNYSLWKNEGFYPKIIIEYNQRVREYYDAFEADKIDEYNQRINDVCEFKIEIVGNVVNKKAKSQSYYKKMNNEWNMLDNSINGDFQCYMICSYLALIDMGYGKKRLNRINEQIIGIFNECCENEDQINVIRQQLEDYGVVVEFPHEKLHFMACVEQEKK